MKKNEDFIAFTTCVNGKFASVFTALRGQGACETVSRPRPTSKLRVPVGKNCEMIDLGLGH